MLTAYHLKERQLLPLDPDSNGDPGQVAWFDAVSLTSDEEDYLEKLLGFELPTRKEMEEIEVSSRLYVEHGAAFMTVVLPTERYMLSPVSFILSERCLVTIRYQEHRPFNNFIRRSAKSVDARGSDTILLGLLETVVDRQADDLERAGRGIDSISSKIFKRTSASKLEHHDFQAMLEEIGRTGDRTSNVRESLVTLQRAVGFLAQVASQRQTDDDVRARIKTLGRDTQSLLDHNSFLSQKINFLLDATLGMINIEQNAIIKIFSVAAVIFLPPTLIASIYGMNFEVMPELGFSYGYPLAILMMIASAIMPFAYFKRRGWL